MIKQEYNNTGGYFLDKQILSITLFFDNSDSFELKIEDLSYFDMKQIHQNVIKEGTHLIEILESSQVVIGMKNTCNESLPEFHEYACLFDRVLDLNDLTNVVLMYSDFTTKCVYIDWENEQSTEFVNANQTNEYKNNDLYITVTKG